MKRLLIWVAAAAAMLSVSPPAFCDTITYDLSGVSLCFPGQGCDTVTGSFSFDTATSAVFNVDIYDNGGAQVISADTFTVGLYPLTYPAGQIPPNGSYEIGFEDATDAEGIGFDLAAALPDSPDDLVVGGWLGGGYNITSVTLTSGYLSGELTATPLPTPAMLFATGLGLLGFMGYWRSKREAAAIAV